MIPVTRIGLPSNNVGEKRAPRAAATEGSRNISLPETAQAAITYPASPISTWTSTVPPARTYLASEGHAAHATEAKDQTDEAETYSK